MKRALVAAAVLAVALSALATLPTTEVKYYISNPNGTFPAVLQATATVTYTTSPNPGILNRSVAGSYNAATGVVTWVLPKNSQVKFVCPALSLNETVSLGTAAAYTLNSLVPASAPLTTPTWAGNYLLRDGTNTMTAPLTFEGTTDDAYEGILSPGDPTGDWTWLMPNESGTVALISDIPAETDPLSLHLSGGRMTGQLYMDDQTLSAAPSTSTLSSVFKYDGVGCGDTSTRTSVYLRGGSVEFGDTLHGGHIGTLIPYDISTNPQWLLPDKDGTIALEVPANGSVMVGNTTASDWNAITSTTKGQVLLINPSAINGVEWGGGTGSELDSDKLDGHDANYFQVAGSYLTAESDPSVYSWAKAATKPSYTYTEVGAAATSHAHSAADITSGNLSALRLPNAAADLGAAAMTVNLSNSNSGGYDTDLITDGRLVGGANALTANDIGRFTAKEAITAHAHYAFLDTSTATFTAPGTYGHASFDSGFTLTGSTAIDHHNSFQDCASYTGSDTLTNYNGFYSLPSHTGGGTISAFANFAAQTPSGAGPIGMAFNYYASGSNTRGSANYGYYEAGTAPNHFGGKTDALRLAESAEYRPDSFRPFGVPYNTAANASDNEYESGESLAGYIWTNVSCAADCLSGGGTATSTAPNITAFPGWLYVSNGTSAFSLGYYHKAHAIGTNANFRIVCHVAHPYQGGYTGIVLFDDNGTGYACLSAPVPGTQERVYGGAVTIWGYPGTVTNLYATPVTYLEIERTGTNRISWSWSEDGLIWTEAGTATDTSAFTRVGVGIYLPNTSATTDHPNVAMIDYIRIQ